MGRTTRMFARTLTVLMLGVGLLTVTAGPASAGDAARNCSYWYSSNNPSSPWNFEVCVKLVHDTNTHQCGRLVVSGAILSVFEFTSMSYS